jgi:DNA-binding response OmpR family regulator
MVCKRESIRGFRDNIAMKILLLEDDATLSQSLKEYLELNGFSVDVAYNSAKVYDLTFINNYDLYIFDINLNSESGFDILEELKSSGDTTPAIYISALSDIESISKGFSIGADDYIKKPFDPEELIVRIKNRYLKEIKEIIKYKNIEFNPKNKEVKVDGKVVSLGEVKSAILYELLKNIGDVVSYGDLIELLEIKSSNALRVNIAKLKDKLNIDIQNIRGLGYMMPNI